jgi:branched-chain amino acid transport system permease protein
METAVVTAINSLMLSAMYILVALGFALLFSIAGILNFAHGALYMLAGYICYIVAVEFGINPWVALAGTIIVMGLLGLFLERFLFRPFWGNLNRTIVTAIAIIVILETGINVSLGAGVLKQIPDFASGLIETSTFRFSVERLVIFAVSAILLAFMVWFITRTKLGLRMQAIAQEREGASLQGINIYRVAAFTFALGCMLAAVAGCFMGSLYNLDPFMGELMLLKIVEVVILGGVGSIAGILVGGLMLGTIDAVLPQFVSGQATQAIALGIIILFLLVRPQGFFGRLV